MPPRSCASRQGRGQADPAADHENATQEAESQITRSAQPAADKPGPRVDSPVRRPADSPRQVPSLQRQSSSGPIGRHRAAVGSAVVASPAAASGRSRGKPVRDRRRRAIRRRPDRTAARQQRDSQREGRGRQENGRPQGRSPADKPGGEECAGGDHGALPGGIGRQPLPAGGGEQVLQRDHSRYHGDSPSGELRSIAAIRPTPRASSCRASSNWVTSSFGSPPNTASSISLSTPAWALARDRAGR